jgi:hypothetical protein
MRPIALVMTTFVLGMSTSCHRGVSQAPVIVRVYRDSSSPTAQRLMWATNRFTVTAPRLKNGQPVSVAIYEPRSYSKDLQQIEEIHPQLVILNSESELPAKSASGMGSPKLICGGKPAYIPAWVSPQQREAANVLLNFLVADCEGGDQR